MRAEDRAGFANAMRQTSMVLGSGKMDEQTLRGYWEALEAYTLPMVEGALKESERIEKFFPKPATLIELIGFAHERMTRETPDDKVSEWERDRRLHPEEYYTQEEIPGVMAEINKRLGFGK